MFPGSRQPAKEEEAELPPRPSVFRVGTLVRVVGKVAKGVGGRQILVDSIGKWCSSSDDSPPTWIQSVARI